MHNDAQPNPVFHVHNSAQAEEPGRNGTCPCGSGRRDEHCCLGKPATASA
jgi:uncharacterized protein YecA (UPF0149 family)